MFPFEIGLDPQRVHAAVVHLPVALAILGIPLVYLTAVSSSDKETLRRLTLAFYAILVPLALLAQWTGEGALDQVPTNMATAVYARLEQHEEMAEKVWMFAAATAVLIAFSTLRLRWFRTVMMSLAMTASLATGGWVAVTGHLGGDLVYSYGVGTPGKALNRPVETVPLPPPPRAVLPAPLPAPVVSVPVPAEVPPVAPPAEITPVAPVAPPAEITPVTPVPAPAEGVPADPSVQLPGIRPIVAEEAAKVSYAKDVRPIVLERCLECHDGDSPKGGLSLVGVADMLKAGKESGPGVVPFKPDESAIVQHIQGITQPPMPYKRAPLTEDELHTIRMWISAGAVDDSVVEPAAPPPAEEQSAPQTETHPTDGSAIEAGKPALGTLLASRGR